MTVGLTSARVKPRARYTLRIAAAPASSVACTNGSPAFSLQQLGELGVGTAVLPVIATASTT